MSERLFDFIEEMREVAEFFQEFRDKILLEIIENLGDCDE